jgi:chromosome segregation ATPase
MHSENTKDGAGTESFSGRDILYRDNAIGLLDVQRAADALLRQGRKPSVAAIREQLGGGSPNTITPLLAKYWEKLGSRLGDGPESLERVPEALARVTELLWRRALEEARERLKLLQSPDQAVGAIEELQEQLGKLSVALAEARAREGEQLSHLATLSRQLEEYRAERNTLLALRKGTRAELDAITHRNEALLKAISWERRRLVTRQVSRVVRTRHRPILGEPKKTVAKARALKPRFKKAVKGSKARRVQVRALR